MRNYHNIRGADQNRTVRAQGGDLSNALSNDSEGKLNWYRGGMSIALDVARGLSYLHSCKVFFLLCLPHVELCLTHRGKSV